MLSSSLDAVLGTQTCGQPDIYEQCAATPDVLTLVMFPTICRLDPIRQSTLKHLSTLDNIGGHLPLIQLSRWFLFDILIGVVRHSFLKISSWFLSVSPRHLALLIYHTLRMA